ncbi:MAG: rod shape-determining protein MreC [Candidatus Omnitrophota bacterium]
MERLKKQIPFLFLFLYLALIFILPARYVNYPKLLITNAISFPLKFFSDTFITLSYVVRSRSLIKENKDLYSQLQDIKARLVELEETKAENARLKEILLFKNESPFNLIACPVISKDSSVLSSSLIIAAGMKHGVNLGTVAITAYGVVGRVTECSFATSRVLLITDPNSRIVAINSRSRSEGMLYGISGGLCRLRYLPLDADIKRGDVIITSGFGSYFPKGLVLGEVIETNKSPDGLSLNAIVKPGFDLSRLEEVLCIK